MLTIVKNRNVYSTSNRKLRKEFSGIKPLFGFGLSSLPIGASPDNGYGLPGPFVSSVFNKYSLHGYTVNGSTENNPVITDEGRAWYFDGSSELPVGNEELQNAFPGGKGATIFVRCKFLSSSITTGIVGCWNPGLSPVWLYGWGLYQDAGTLRGVCAWNDSKNINASIPELGKWVTIALRLGVSDGGLFIDGIKVASGDLTNSNTSAYSFSVGSKKQSTISAPSGRTYPWNGFVSQILHIPKALSDSQISILRGRLSEIFEPETIPLFYSTVTAQNNYALQFIRKVRDRQPKSIPKIDWKNPITKELKVCIIPTCGFNNIVNGIVGIGHPVISCGEDGIYFSGDGTTQYTVDQSTKIDVSLPISGFVRGQFYASGAAICGTRNNGFGWSIAGTADAVIQHFILFNVVDQISTAISDQYLGDFGKTFSNGVTHTPASTNGLVFYAKGRQQGSPVNTATPIASNNNIGFLGFGDGSGLTSGGYKLSVLLLWQRTLDAREHAELDRNPWQVFEPETIPLFFSTVTAQYARPTSDVSTGTWTASSGSDLFAMLDETTASDADYIVTTGASTCEVALGTLSDPASSSGHVVRYRISADAGGITVRLRQGTTTIATWTHASAPTSLTTYAQTLTSGEADSITDYTALRLQFEAT